MSGRCWSSPATRSTPGEVLFILEVMKTEVAHEAEAAGTVRTVYITEGQEGVDAGRSRW